MIKKNCVAFIIGLIIWGVLSFFVYPIITIFIVNKGLPILIIDAYSFFQYALIGIAVGYFGEDKKKGVFIGLLFGIIIAAFFVSIGFVTNLLNESAYEINRVKTISAILISHSIFTVYIIIGSFTGHLIRVRKKQ